MAEEKPQEAQSKDEVVNLSVADSTDDDQEQGPTRMTKAKWLACLALGLGYTTAFQQLACTGTILRHIDEELGHSSQYNWMLAAYTLAQAVCLPLNGGLSDIFGRRWFFMGGCVVSLVGTIIAVSAQSVNTVIAGMALKGVGSASQQLALAGISEIVPNKHRGIAAAVIDVVTTPWTMFGALAGNAMVKYSSLSFRINWYVGIALNVITIIASYFFYHPPSHPHAEGKTKMQQFREIDWIGVALFASGLSLLLAGIGFGGVAAPWVSAQVLAPIFIGATLLIVLCVWEWKFAAWPFMDRELFRRGRTFSLVLGIVFVSGMGLYAGTAFWPQQVQLMFSDDPIRIGVLCIAGGAGGAVGGFISGVIIGRHKWLKTNWNVSFGVIMKVIAGAALTTVTPETEARAIGLTFLSGCGTGWVSVSLIVAVQLACADKNIGLATTMLGSFRAVGGTVAIAVYSTILQNKVTSVIGKDVGAAVVPLGISPANIRPLVLALSEGHVDQALKIPGVTARVLLAAKAAIGWSYAAGFRDLYTAALSFAAAAFVASLFMRDVSHNMTNHVAVRLENEVSEREITKA